MTRAPVSNPHILQSVLQAFPPVGQPPKHEVDHLAPSSFEFKHSRKRTSTVPMRFHDEVLNFVTLCVC